jgi:hypothetical protein
MLKTHFDDLQKLLWTIHATDGELMKKLDCEIM